MEFQKTIMKKYIITVIICVFISYPIKSIGQSVKLTKEERKQERKNIDSLFIVHSLPIDVLTTKEFVYTALKDSVIEILKSKKYECPKPSIIKSLIADNMFAFLPSPVTEKEKYLETMEKVAKDKSYYFTLMELADPFLQNIVLSSEKNDLGIDLIIVKRQNLPNAKKERLWTFKQEDSESIQSLASRIIDTLINTKQN